VFWIIKIAAITLRETCGDVVSTSMKLCQLVETGIFGTIFFFMVIAQISAKRFRLWLYWTTIIATTTLWRYFGGFRWSFSGRWL
jgi:uncharacterized membrane-anchored protein